MASLKVVLLLLFLVLFSILTHVIEGAGASGRDLSDDEDEFTTPDGTNTESPILITPSMFQSSYESEFLLVIFTSVLIGYLTFILQIGALFDRELCFGEMAMLKDIYSDILLESNFCNKMRMIKESRHIYFQMVLDSYDLSVFEDIMTEETQASKKVFDTIVSESKHIREKVLLLISSIKSLLTLCSNDLLNLRAKLVVESAVKWLPTLDTSEEKYKRSQRRDIVKILTSNKELFESSCTKILINNLGDRFDAQRRSSRQSNIKLISDYKEYLQTGSTRLTATEIKRVESFVKDLDSVDSYDTLFFYELLMTAIFSVDFLGFVAQLVFYFNKEILLKFLKSIRELKLKIEKLSATISLSLNISEEDAIQVKEKVYNQLGFSNHGSFNYMLLGMKETVGKEEIISCMKKIYLILLENVSLLKSKQDIASRCRYLKTTFTLSIEMYERFLKQLMNSLKEYKSLGEDKMKYEKYMNTSEKRLEKIKVEKDTKVKREKEEKKRIQEEKEEKRKKEETERMLLKEQQEERKRQRELEKKNRRRTRSRREYPQAGDSEDRLKESGIRERSKSRERETMVTPSSTSVLSASGHSSRSKQKKESKLEKLIKEESKSEMRARIQAVILQQKQTQISEKKRKQVERRNKKDDARNKEKKEREEEKEREREEERRKNEEIAYNNFLYSLLSSVSSIEGLYDESGKDRNKELGALISCIVEIVAEDIDGKEEDLETISNLIAGISISDGEAPGSSHKADSSSASGGRRRAYEVPTEGGASVPTSQLFGSGAVFSTRGRSRSKSRAASRSRSRSRSGSTSRSTPSRSRKTSRSRSRSRSKSEQREGSGSESLKSSLEPHFKAGNSKFAKFFSSSSEKAEKPDSSPFLGLRFFGVTIDDYPNINEDSSRDEVVSALENVGNEIQRLHLEVAPLLTGEDFFAVKQAERMLVRVLIRLLLILNGLKG
ncbi:putative Secreted Protein (SKSR family) [Cryptosporidium felis]|nr:putative Secreted Protein (SKSR family) [Cryptosporidium felis]